jgi:hypothetical protein
MIPGPRFEPAGFSVRPSNRRAYLMTACGPPWGSRRSSELAPGAGALELRLVALVRVADQLLLVLREKVVLLVCADAEDVRDDLSGVHRVRAEDVVLIHAVVRAPRVEAAVDRVLERADVLTSG